MRGKDYAIMGLVILALISAAAYSYTQLSSYDIGIESNFLPSCTHTEGYVTIIGDHRGYNDSISHGAPENPWPVIIVKRGDTVNLTFCNLDRVSPHAFAIDRYFDRGVVLRAGQGYQISFTASEPGSFRIYCNIQCPPHRYMRGSLTVA